MYWLQFYSSNNSKWNRQYLPRCSNPADFFPHIGILLFYRCVCLHSICLFLHCCLLDMLFCHSAALVTLLMDFGTCKHYRNYPLIVYKGHAVEGLLQVALIVKLTAIQATLNLSTKRRLARAWERFSFSMQLKIFNCVALQSQRKFHEPDSVIWFMVLLCCHVAGRQYYIYIYSLFSSNWMFGWNQNREWTDFIGMAPGPSDSPG